MFLWMNLGIVIAFTLVYIYILYVYSMRELHKAHSSSDVNSNESRNHQDEWGSS